MAYTRSTTYSLTRLPHAGRQVEFFHGKWLNWE